MHDWPKIVTRHKAVVWQTAYRLLGNHADAADCLQETFVAAMEVSRKQRVRNWAGLLQQLATRRALDRLRQRKRRADRHDDLADWSTVACSNPGPAQDAEEAELAAMLRRALAQLPAQQAEVFSLRQLNELSYREIGEQLGIEVNEVGVLLHRARTRLKVLLGSALGEDKGEVC
jgi:RNA polymerase sigma-70 factor (ECF subfamily)